MPFKMLKNKMMESFWIPFYEGRIAVIPTSHKGSAKSKKILTVNKYQ